MIDTTKLTRAFTLTLLGSIILLSQLSCSLSTTNQKHLWIADDTSNYYEEQSDVAQIELENSTNELKDLSIRYVTFSLESLEVSEQGIEELRLISIYQEKHPESDIIITSTSSEYARIKAIGIKMLIEKFGAKKDHLQLVVDNDFSKATDTTLMIQISDNSFDNQLEIIATN